MNNKVAFLLHPISIGAIRHNFRSVYKKEHFLIPILNRLSDRTLKQLYTLLPPHELTRITGITSKPNHVIDLHVIMLPFFPSQLITMNRIFVERAILKSIQLAEKMGARLVGLGGFTSIVTNQGLNIVNRIDSSRVSVTTGNTLTAALCVEGILKACEIGKKNPDELILLVVGATGDLGSAVSRALFRSFKQIILMSRNISCESVVYKEAKLYNSKAEYCRQLSSDLLQNVDVIFVATSSYDTIIDLHILKSGAIIADASIPSNVNSCQRDDITFFLAGRASMNESLVRDLSFLFSSDEVFGCLAEVLTLGLESRFENFSIGRGNILIEKMDEIRCLAASNDIRLGGFGSFSEVS